MTISSALEKNENCVSTAAFSGSNPLAAIAFDAAGIKAKLLNLEEPCHVVRFANQLGVTHTDPLRLGTVEPLMTVPPLQQLGDPSFLAWHGVKMAYAAGAMAGGIASEDLVIALGKAGILSSFGSGGLGRDLITAAIHRIQDALPQGPYAFNLLHSPNDAAMERNTVELYLKHHIRTVEASAFINLTPSLVYYRAAGLQLSPNQHINIQNKIIAKLSRREVATQFLQPAPATILKTLAIQGLISEQQAQLAAQVPMADDITVEADSGGHTDNRPLVCLLPAILALRDEIQTQYSYRTPVRIGVAGGISTPQSALAALMMGAAYVVTGSVNQSCLEAAASPHTKRLLAEAEMHDVIMAPAADMFEMGVKLQVLKKGTLFPLRAQKLFDLYKTHNAIEDIPQVERHRLEQQIFRRPLDEVWQETQAYLVAHKPEKLAKAANNPKLKMALIFRWYLGLSSRWSKTGECDRIADYQIWCGPAMGAFNNWVKGTYLEAPDQRRVVDVAIHMMRGAAFLYRVNALKLQGLNMPAHYGQYRPIPPE
ncbi:PfaD family polyunsaturated fatty acid/polyketide biosynthesis protein [Acaryochloris sp. IP29b_bin.148]|uniref:PfaD family polyunsaturated fatty acid/polyketide biosynthesis protein n=1 Tax=Acaryochloris sp. IP29b_bin.148 TaxID=2969218 RepID=UPI002609130B|nr:PfaD family polyunsaturated fatty acid/polyketide biosynthesis protein [Acaryochloris sp. IP29b_bin.148]